MFEVANTNGITWLHHSLQQVHQIKFSPDFFNLLGKRIPTVDNGFVLGRGAIIQATRNSVTVISNLR